MKTRILWSLAGTIVLFAAATAARADVVEYFLQPVASVNYSSTFTANLNDAITTNAVSTTATSGTIYFNVYAGLNQANSTATDDGVNFAFLNFMSSGTIGTVPTSISLSFSNGFNTGTGATTGTSVDLNNDGNLDLGSTYASSAGAAGTHPYWSYFKLPGTTYFYGTGSASGAGDRTNILLGVIGYTYTIAPANTGTTQSASLTLNPRVYNLAQSFGGTVDNVAVSTNFSGAASSACLNLISSVMMPTITYQPAASGTGVFSLGFTTEQPDLLLNSTSPLTYTLSNVGSATINNWTLTSGASGGTATVSPTSGTNFLQSTTVTPSPTGTYSAGNVAGNYVITATAASTDNGVVTVTSTQAVNVGQATANPGGPTAATATYGVPLSGCVAANGSFKSLSAIVTGGAGNLGTVATILDGTNGGVATTVNMAFRTRATDEMPGTAQEPPMAPNGQWLASDVLNLTGIATGTPYVLQMTYNAALFHGDDAGQTAAGFLWLGAYQPGHQWELANTEDSEPNGVDAQYGVYESYANFMASLPPETTLSQVLGSYGTDPTGACWAVIDYDSDYNSKNFGVVPEPGTFALLLAGAFVLVPVIRRRMKKA